MFQNGQWKCIKMIQINGRIIRGGSFNSNNFVEPISYRKNMIESARQGDIGFRIALYIK